jgi:hypothetical protein
MTHTGKYGGLCLCGHLNAVTSDRRETFGSVLVVHGRKHCFTVLRDAVVPHPVRSMARSRVSNRPALRAAIAERYEHTFRRLAASERRA